MKADRINADKRLTHFICFFVNPSPPPAITTLDSEIFNTKYSKQKKPPPKKFIPQLCSGTSLNEELEKVKIKNKSTIINKTGIKNALIFDKKANFLKQAKKLRVNTHAIKIKTIHKFAPSQQEEIPAYIDDEKTTQHIIIKIRIVFDCVPSPTLLLPFVMSK